MYTLRGRPIKSVAASVPTSHMQVILQSLTYASKGVDLCIEEELYHVILVILGGSNEYCAKCVGDYGANHVHLSMNTFDHQ